MYFLGAFACTAVNLCVLKSAGANIFAALSTPCEVNIAALGKQTNEDPARAAKGKKGRQPPHRPFFIPH